VRPTLLEFNKAALIHNFERLASLAPGQDSYIAVKANGYGHGAVKVAQVIQCYLQEAAHEQPLVDKRPQVGCAVACFEEAKALREAGIRLPLLVLNGALSKDEVSWAAQHQVTWVIHNHQQAQWVVSLDIEHMLWLKVNTGMNRLGFDIEEVDTILDQLLALKRVRLSHLMTHFACADTPSHPTHLRQLQRWRSLITDVKLRSDAAHMKFSCANSAAIWSTPEAVMGTLRPGIALYGCSPFHDQVGSELGLKPVMRLKAGLISIHSVKAGEAVGYGANYAVESNKIVGVLAVGYGDGYPRHAPSGTPVWFRGQVCPVIGNVSMDMVVIDLTTVSNPSIGEMAELWGEHLPVEKVAQYAETIGYELYCGMWRGHLGLSSQRVDCSWVDR
jgi:alanine racemase